MPSLRTRTEIFNDVLDKLNEQPISSASDTSKSAQWLTRNFEQQRDYLLERYFWKFALTRKQLPADPDPPEWGWSYRYLVPTDALRLAPLTADGEWNGVPLIFEREGQYILCDVPDGLKLRYVSRVTEDGLLSNGFIECLTLRLSMMMAHWITGKQSMTQQLQQMYQATLSETIQTEAVQVATEDYYDDDILTWRTDFS